jgi:hypothetical protein
MNNRTLASLLRLSFLFPGLILGSKLQAASPVGASFLNINPSAQIAALGGAGSAVVKGAGSLFLNPAGLTASDKREILATHMQLFSDASFDAFGYAHPFFNSDGKNKLSIGLSGIYMNEGTLQSRDLNRQVTGTFNASNSVAALSIGKFISSRLSIGGTVKFVQERISDQSAAGVAFDIGTQIGNNAQGLSMGMSVNNLGRNLKFVDEPFSLPTEAHLGLGYGFGSLTLVTDGQLPLHGGNKQFGLGTEYRPIGMISLRMGYVTTMGTSYSAPGTLGGLSRFAGVGAGLGLKFGSAQFDYALIPHAALDQTQQFTFSLKY